MKKYIVKLHVPLEDVIETRFNDADIFITYKPKLDYYLIFVETNHSAERIKFFDCVKEVRESRKYSFGV